MVEDANPFQSGPGVKHARRLWPDRAQGPWELEVTYQEVEGRLECVGMAVSPATDPPAVLNASTFRRLRPADLISELDTEKKRHLEELARRTATAPTPPGMWRPPFSDVVEPLPKSARGGRPAIYDEDHFVKVAAIYDEAWKRHENPTVAVNNAWPHYSRSAIAKWVAEARRRQLLPATVRGQAIGAGTRDEGGQRDA